MEMLRQILPPRVQNRGDADRAAEMPRVSPEGEQRVGGGTKEKRVDHARIALGEGIERMREGEDDVEVRNRQEVGLAGGEPALLCGGLALRAVAIATGVIGDARRATAVTRLLMSAERGGAASLNRVERPALDGGQAVRATIRLAVGTHDVRELESRT